MHRKRTLCIIQTMEKRERKMCYGPEENPYPCLQHPAGRIVDADGSGGCPGAAGHRLGSRPPCNRTGAPEPCARTGCVCPERSGDPERDPGGKRPADPLSPGKSPGKSPGIQEDFPVFCKAGQSVPGKLQQGQYHGRKTDFPGGFPGKLPWKPVSVLPDVWL